MIFEQEWQVRIAEVDTKLKMKLTGVLESFQETATLQFEELGFGIKNRSSDSVAVIILNSKLNMMKMPKWNETVTIRTWCNEINRIYCYRNYEILNSNNKVIGTGWNKAVLLDLENRKIKRLDEKIKEDIKLEDKFVYKNDWKEIEIPEIEPRESYQIIRNRDIDINGHVNNVSFIEIALNALTKQEYKAFNKKNLEVCYKKECKNQERVKCVLYEQNNQCVIVIKDETQDITYAIIKLY